MKQYKKFTLSERYKFFEYMTDKILPLVNGTTVCIQGNYLENIKVIKRFGTPSAYGEAWIGETRKAEIIAIKKMTLSKSDLNGKPFSTRHFKTGGSGWIEVAAYIICSALVIAGVTQNLPITFRYYSCPNCTFENKTIGLDKGHCIITINELGDGDLKMFLKPDKIHIWNEELAVNCVFQIFAGLYSLKKIFNMTHNDLHWGNVLVHKIKPGGYWEYIIDGYSFCVPNLGYVFVIWDFGMIHIPGKIKGRSEFLSNADRPVRGETDIGRIVYILYDELKKKKVMKKNELLEYIVRYESNLEDLVKMFTLDFGIATPKGNKISTFNLDIDERGIKAVLPRQLQHLIG
jgi:hypothetical protein